MHVSELVAQQHHAAPVCTFRSKYTANDTSGTHMQIIQARGNTGTENCHPSLGKGTREAWVDDAISDRSRSGCSLHLVANTPQVLA